MSELLARKTHRPDKIAYIPNWVDAQDVIPRTRRSGYLPEAWNGKIVFQFFGNLGRVQGLPNLLAALALVKHPRAAFVFIGAGSGEALIERFLREHPALCAIRKPALPFSENNIGLAACDVAIVSLAGGMKGLAVPSKAYFSMAADRPLLVIGDPQSELHRLLEEERSIGWYCPPDQPQALAALIDGICERGVDALCAAPREVVVRRFSYADSVRAYARELEALGLRPALDRPLPSGL
jgi:glycosyltransferase involved in cell wall biosynthesis